MTNYAKLTEAELRRQFSEHADAIRNNNHAVTIYLRCNSMRSIWKELQRRGLPDPIFPPTVADFRAIFRQYERKP